MKKLCLLSALLAGLPAQMQNAVDVGAEPHHHLVLANSAVRAFRVEVPPHQATLLHEHPRDYVFVALGDAEFTNAVAGKLETRVTMKDASLHFSRGGFAHVATDERDTPFRNVTIELERPQGTAHNLCEKINEAEPLRCSVTASTEGNDLVPQFETDATRVVLRRLAPMRYTAGTAKFDELIVALQDTEVEVVPRGQPSRKLRPGEVMWLAHGTRRGFANVGKSTARILTLEFKDSAAQP